MGEAQTFVGGAAGFGTESGRVHGSNGCYITAYGGQKKELVAKLDILKPQIPPGVPAGGQAGMNYCINKLTLLAPRCYAWVVRQARIVMPKVLRKSALRCVGVSKPQA